jgi:thiol:disulfide interchange protein
MIVCIVHRTPATPDFKTPSPAPGKNTIMNDASEANTRRGRRGSLRLLACLMVAACLVPLWPPAAAAQMIDSSDKVRLWAQPDRAHVVAGGQLVVAVVFDHADKWHIHTHAPDVPPELGSASFYIATQIKAAEEGGVLRPHLPFIQWPTPKPVQVAFVGKPVTYEVFAGKAVAYLPVTVADDALPGPATLTIHATYQACDDRQCLAPVFDQPVEIHVQVMTADALAAAAAAPVDPALFAGFDVSVWPLVQAGAVPPALVEFDLFGWAFALDIGGPIGLALLLIMAGLGGFLLNLTPCVLPVIPIKIMGLSQMAGSRSRCLALGAMLAAGIVAFWLSIGIAVATVSGFLATNQLFQYPLFGISVGLFIAVMAVGMCGLFSVRLPRVVYKVEPRHDTYFGSFVFGIMAAVLSTPCTAPFMGAAAAGAVAQRPSVSVLAFLAIGLGMAVPYLVLAASPKLVERMPRTGPASDLIKQVMGLLMLAAASYFFFSGLGGWLVKPPYSPPPMEWYAVGLFIVAAGGWLAYRTLRLRPSPGMRATFAAVGLLLILAGAHIGWHFTRPAPIAWVYYTPQEFAQAIDRGDRVLLEFTANWCINCRVMEQAVLHDRRVVEALRQPGVVPMKVDLSGNNPIGNQKLRQLDRLTIPLLVVFAPDGREVFKGDYYTVEQVLGALQEAPAAAASAKN